MSIVISQATYDFNSVLIQPKYNADFNVSSRNDVSLERTFKFKHGSEWTGVPIIAANMDTTGTFEVYQELSKQKLLTSLHKFYTLEDFKHFKNENILNPEYFMVSTGISDSNYYNLVDIVDNIECKWICIDIANGYLDAFRSFCKRVREKYPEKIIVAGNVVTPEIVSILINDCGVDIVKLGIGPGSACTTRIKTGVGVPQLSAIMNCREVAHNSGGFIISDGGITCPGDMAKAFGANADFVMMGGQFAGHNENPGEIIEENGKEYKLFYGMSSEFAMNKRFGGMNTYRSSEGRCIKIPYKGPLMTTVNDYLGGVRSTCTYIGVSKLGDMYKNTTFIVVPQQANKIFV